MCVTASIFHLLVQLVLMQLVDPTESSAESVCPLDGGKREMNGLEVGDVNTGSLPDLRTCVKSLLSGLDIELANG